MTILLKTENEGGTTRSGAVDRRSWNTTAPFDKEFKVEVVRARIPQEESTRDASRKMSEPLQSTGTSLSLYVYHVAAIDDSRKMASLETKKQGHLNE